MIEFFSYGCPHCADLEPDPAGLAEDAAADVQFRRVPVMFQERWITLAKIYYTLDALGEDKRLSPEVFDAIHKQRPTFATEKIFFDWAASKGLDRKKVEDMYNSFAIDGQDEPRQVAQAQQYNIQSVPTVVVDGKFITATARSARTRRCRAAIDALIAKARAERPKT